MPYDGSITIKSADTLLKTALRSGLTPIYPSYLECHMAQEIERHPANWLYRNRDAILEKMAKSAVIAFAAISGSVLLLYMTRGPWAEFPKSHIISAFALMVGMCAALVIAVIAIFIEVSMFVKVKGPAIWKIRAATLDEPMPAQIREAARILDREVVSLTFLIGELYQEKLLLDPYLIACDPAGDKIILGIWDGDKVIACA